MFDVSFYVLAALGVALLGAGIALIIGRNRIAKNMKAADVIPRRVESSVGYVVGLGVLQIFLGVLFCILAGVTASRDDFGKFYWAMNRLLQMMGLDGTLVGLVLTLLGIAAVVAGIPLFRRGWRSRAEWGQPGQPVKMTPAATLQINGAAFLVIFGGISVVFGLILLFGAFFS